MYHRKFKMHLIFGLRVPYMSFFGLYVGLVKYPGRRSLLTGLYLASQFVKGYRSWPKVHAEQNAHFASKT
jgi:hypothetical protein